MYLLFYVDVELGMPPQGTKSGQKKTGPKRAVTGDWRKFHDDSFIICTLPNML
jgi:hypothetical protein